MFQSLPEIQRLSSTLAQFKRQRTKLQQMYQKSSGNSQRVEQQLCESILDHIKQAKKKLQYCNTLEEEVYNEQFIHGQFFVQDLIYHTIQLPQWFNFVFEKQFDKQRSYFSGIARRMYSQYGLHQKKMELESQIHNFQILNQRYQQITSKSEKGLMNIDRQAQSFQNRVELIASKFVTFIQAISQKIVFFVEENVQRSLNYTQNIKNFTQNSSHHTILPRQTNGFHQSNAMNLRPTRQGYSIQKVNTMPSRDHVKTVGSPERIGMKRSPSAQLNSLNDHHPTCLNHGHHHNINHYRAYNPPLNIEYPPIMLPNTGSRFNYRDHMPRYMTATSFLHHY